MPKSVTELMDDLIADRSVRTKLAQLRDVFADVDRALSRGVSSRAVCAALSSTGLELSERMLRRYVSQLRDERSVRSATPESQPQSRHAQAPAQQAVPVAPRPEVSQDTASEQTLSTPPVGSLAKAYSNRSFDEVMNSTPDVFRLEQERRLQRRLAKVRSPPTTP